MTHAPITDPVEAERYRARAVAVDQLVGALQDFALDPKVGLTLNVHLRSREDFERFAGDSEYMPECRTWMKDVPLADSARLIVYTSEPLVGGPGDEL